MEWIVPQMLKLLPKRHIFFDLDHEQEVGFLSYFLGQIVS